MNVVSDLTGTLTTGSAVLGMVDWVRHHQSRWRADVYFLSRMPSYGLVRLGLMDFQSWAYRLMISALPLVKDPTPEKLQLIAEWSVEETLWPRRREDILARLSGHIDEGASVTIISGVYEPTAQAFAKRIGAIGIGTPVEISEGQIRLAAKIVSEEEKIEQLFSRLGVDHFDVAYGDTWADISLLENAKKPVAVYPDDALKKVALERGWEITGVRDI